MPYAFVCSLAGCPAYTCLLRRGALQSILINSGKKEPVSTEEQQGTTAVLSPTGRIPEFSK
jgi:hypothetical protein